MSHLSLKPDFPILTTKMLHAQAIYTDRIHGLTWHTRDKGHLILPFAENKWENQSKSVAPAVKRLEVPRDFLPFHERLHLRSKPATNLCSRPATNLRSSPTIHLLFHLANTSYFYAEP